MKPTLPAPDTVNPLFEGLKQLVRQAVREELQNSLIARNGKPEKLLFDTEEAAQFLNVRPLGSHRWRGSKKSKASSWVTTFDSRGRTWKRLFRRKAESGKN